MFNLGLSKINLIWKVSTVLKNLPSTSATSLIILVSYFEVCMSVAA